MTFAIQQALFVRLGTLGYPVYDRAPQVPDGGSVSGWPYIEIGVIALAPFDTFDKTGFDFVARIHSRSRSAGMKECKEMQSAIYGALHRAELVIAGFNFVSIAREASEVMVAPDGTIHGVCEYRGLVEAI